MILGLPAMRALRRRFPHAEITFVAPLPHARVARWDPLVDRVLDFGEPSFAPLVTGAATEWPSLLEPVDVAVVWLRDHESVGESLRRLGVAQIVGRAPLDAISERRHMAQWLSASIEVLDVPARLGVGRLAAPTPAESVGTVMHPGSGSARKNWAGWAELVASLAPERTTVLGGPADERAVAALLASWPSGVPVPDVRAGLSLEAVAGTLAGASLYLGNDSGVTHLAAALGAPTVAIFGPTDPRIWRPVGPREIALGGTHVDAGIFAESPQWPSVDEVLWAARDLAAQTE